MFTGLRRFGASGTHKVALMQAGLAPSAMLAGWAIADRETGFALLYGVLVALAVTTVLVWRESQAIRHPEWDQHRLFKVFIRAGIERFVLLAGLLIMGLALLKLDALPLMLGLVVAQFGWLAAANSRRAK